MELLGIIAIIAMMLCLVVAWARYDTQRSWNKRWCWHPNVGWYEPLHGACYMPECGEIDD